MPQPRFYSKTQIVLHWLIVVMILFQYLAADGITELWQARMSGAMPNEPAPELHAAMGIALAVAMLFRLVLVFRNGFPPLPRNTAIGIKRFVRSIDVLFYVLILVLFLTGVSAWFGGSAQAGELHNHVESLLLLVIAAHIAGSLAQQFWFRNNVLKRMIGMR